MGYRSLAECVVDLERSGQLLRVKEPLDPYLEIPEIQRRLYALKAPAVLFEQVQGSPFRALSNLYGTLERTRWLFRDQIKMVEWLIQAKADPFEVLRSPHKWLGVPGALLNALPKRVNHGPVMMHQTQLSNLPQIHSWPEDGGAFITLPQVCTLDARKPSIFTSNMGMYRIQLSGNEFTPNEECGMHYQIHRGIGVHHHAAIEQGVPLKVSIFVGGPPSHGVAAVMPLPEGMPEIAFAGVLGGRRFRYAMQKGWVISTEADFCILGEVSPDLKPEGPFGDHLGFYSLKHDFPFLKVHAVYHRPGAIWPITVVGRPPQEDTTFGDFIHEISGAMVPASVPGVKEIHAVDAAGVHPLLLAIGSERYVPYEDREPMEILTQANALLGFNQVSLAKYLLIVAQEDAPNLNTRDIVPFFSHLLERIDFSRDLHFQTHTTMDTLDYSGYSMNRGSKLVMAAAGRVQRTLGRSESDLGAWSSVMAQLKSTPNASQNAFRIDAPLRVVMPGVLALTAPRWTSQAEADQQMQNLCQALEHWDSKDQWPWITLVDDADFAARTVDNWLWTTFVRSNPSHDISGVGAKTEYKHWSCTDPLVVDARAKNHHAKALVEDPKVTKKVDALFAKNGVFGSLG